MYSDKKKSTFLPRVIILAVLIVACIAGFTVKKNSARSLSEESAAAVKDAIRRSALQCYAVEGIYPPTLEYLEDNYGLQVNTRDFYIRYDIFASNIAPEITVTGK